MEALRRWFAIVLADFRERSRSTRFWVVLGGVAIATWWCFPPASAGYVTVAVGELRGAYSPAWVGMVLALMYASMLTLAGFYIVRGTVVRDFETRVWQLLVATPMTRAGWLLAKWSSHMAVLMLLVFVGLGVGLVAQFWRGESAAVAPWQLLQPSLVLTLPALALAATFAVLFDLVPWLRRSGGNVLYFFLWIFVFISLAQTFDPDEATRETGIWMSEPGGLSLAMRDIRLGLAAVDPALAEEGFSIGASLVAGEVRTFAWDAWVPRPIDLLGRAIWVLVALGGLLAMTPLVDWAAARSGVARVDGGGSGGLRLRWLEPLLAPFDRFRAGRLIAAECRLVLRQRRLTWWLALGVLWIVQAVAPEKGRIIVPGWPASTSSRAPRCASATPAPPRSCSRPAAPRGGCSGHASRCRSCSRSPSSRRRWCGRSPAIRTRRSRSWSWRPRWRWRASRWALPAAIRDRTNWRSCSWPTSACRAMRCSIRSPRRRRRWRGICGSCRRACCCWSRRGQRPSAGADAAVIPVARCRRNGIRCWCQIPAGTVSGFNTPYSAGQLPSRGSLNVPISMSTSGRWIA